MNGRNENINPAGIRRVRLFEFEDQAWLPALFRNYITEIVQYQVTSYRIYAPVAGKIKGLMQRAGCDQIIDLCSGAGGPLLQIQQILRDEDDFHVSVVMTDRFPNSDVIKRLQQTGVEDVTYLDASIDATSVPDHLKGLRTLFTSFHHLDPDLAIKVLQSAVEDQAAIAVFEFTERKFLKFIGALLSPIAVLFQTPRISPLSWGKLLWTYLLPVIPLMYLWDCAISHLRSYTVMELQELVLNVKAERYNWQVGIVVPEQTRDTITYLIGFPARSEEPTSACIF